MIEASLVAQMIKNPLAMQEKWVRSLGQEDPPGGGNGSLFLYSCLENTIFLSCILWTEEPGQLQSMGSQRVRQTERLTFTHSRDYFQNNFWLFLFSHLVVPMVESSMDISPLINLLI